MQNKSLEIKFFDQAIGKQGELEVVSSEAYDSILYLFNKCVKNIKNQKVLEIGCGTGKLTTRFSKLDAKVIGIDISKKSIERAKEKYNYIDFIVADAESLPFKNETFNYTIFSGVIHHFPDPDDALSEARRITKTAGKTFSIDPSSLNPFVFLFRSPKSILRTTRAITLNERPLSKKELRYRFKKAGFKKTQFIYFSAKIIPHVTLSGNINHLESEIFNFFEEIFKKVPVLRQLSAFIITMAEVSA